MLKSLTALVAMSLLVSGSAMAEQRVATKPSSQPARVATLQRVSERTVARPAKVSCEDLMAFDQASRPQSVTFAQGRVRCELQSH